jgi:TRAP-type mannitol/chloroaromatic compound transport system substrate-binding protein
MEKTCNIITAASGGRLEMKPYSGGAIVPGNKEHDGIDTGAVDFAWTVPSFWLDRFPTAGLFCYQVCGLTPVEHYGWIMQGGGAELFQEMLAGTNIYYLPGSGYVGTPETFMHSSVPVTTVADIKGLKMRAAGDGGEIMARLGASVVFFPGYEIYENMQRGIIDAFEMSNPTFDWSQSVYEVAPYLYISPSRQPAEYAVAIVNTKSWAALPDDLKVLVEEISRTTAIEALYYFMDSDAEHLQKFRDYGTEVSLLSEDIEEAMAREAAKFYAEKSAQDPFFAKVYDSATVWKEKLRAGFPSY